MKKAGSIFIKNLRYLCLAGVIVLGLMTIVGTGGGGGGGGDVISDDPAPVMPSRVEYYIGGPGGNPTTSGLTYTIDTATISVTMALKGIYTRADRAYTLDVSPIPRMGVSTNGLDFSLLFDPFDIRVDETLQWRYGEYPTAGQFRAASGNFVTVAVNNNVNGTGVAGVDLQLVEFGSPTASVSLTWAEFDAVLDNSATAPPYQVQAAFSFWVIKAAYQHVQSIINSIDTIAVNEAALENAGSGNGLTFTCDQLSSTAGSYQFVWHDAPGEISDALGPGDNFTWSFTECWLDDATLNEDLLYVTGEIELNEYGESSNPLRLSFVDVVANDLVVTETEGMAGAATLGTTMTINSFSTGGRGGVYVELLPDTSGVINLTNVFSIAEVGASTVTLPFEYGEFFINLLEDIAASPALSGTVLCPVSGSIDYVMDANPVTNGTTIDFTCNTCVEGTVTDPVTVTGAAALTVNTIIGTLTSGGIYNVNTTLAFDNFGTQDDVGLVVVNGSMNFTTYPVCDRRRHQQNSNHIFC